MTKKNLTDVELVYELIAVDHGLTRWDLDFVESIATRVLDLIQELTPKQREKAYQVLQDVEDRNG